MKLVFAVLLIVLIPAFISEASSYFGGDMVDLNFEKYEKEIPYKKSDIIKFNEQPNEQQLKRYLIFGKGSHT